MVITHRPTGRPADDPPASFIPSPTNQDKIRAEERKKVQADLAAQAKRVRPVATQRASNGRFADNKHEARTINEKVQEVANSPAVVAAWEKVLETSGAR